VVPGGTRDSRQVRARRRTTSGVEPIESAGVRAPRVRPTPCARVPLSAGVIRSGASLVLCSPFGRGEPVPHGRGARRNRGCNQRIHPIGRVPPAKAGVEVAFIHRSAWKGNSANFALTECSEGGGSPTKKAGATTPPQPLYPRPMATCGPYRYLTASQVSAASMAASTTHKS
jgi:hypothetical protein